LDPWLATPLGRLSLIVVLDQFSTWLARWHTWQIVGAEHPFGSGAQGNEPKDKDEHPDQAPPLQLGKQAICSAS
jgi:hypothetical protein